MTLLGFSLCAVLLTACEDEPFSPGRVVEQAPHEQDLDVMDTWLALEQSWPPGSLEAAQGLMAELRALEMPLLDIDFFLRVSRITALADNAHSRVGHAAVYNAWGVLPIRVFWFVDGLYVVRAAPSQADLLGARIVAIEGESLEALVDRMGMYLGGPDEFFRAYFPHSLLLSPPVLNAAGVAPGTGGLRITVERGGAEEEVDVPVGPAPTPAALPWRYLSPDPIQGENGWSTVLSLPGEVPWALQQPGLPFRYRMVPGTDVAHVQFRTNRDVGGASIFGFLEQVETQMALDQPRHVILDNRANDGGNLTRTASWASSIHDALPPDGFVYSLTSHATFSAGIYTAFFPEAAEPERTVVVGTLVGDRPRFFAEGSQFTLPLAGHPVSYSDLAHDLGAPCDGAECLFWNDPQLDIEVATLAPEVVGGFTFEEFAAGRDPDVEKVLARIGS